MGSNGRPSSILDSPGRIGVPTPSSTRKAMFSGYSEETRPTTNARKKRRKKPISLNVTATKYEIVRTVAQQYGTLTIKDDDPNCFMFWNDTAIPPDRIAELKPYQRINHFPGMGEICRKDCLARNMLKMYKRHPDDFSFVPKTWIFPAEYSSFQNHVHDLKRKKKSRTYIVKPANGSMGQGIMLFRNGEKIPPQDHMIVQEYMDKPFLLEGFKFDLRVYVLVTSCDPLRIFLYPDGLVRMGTEQYVAPTDSNIDQLFMHLTNYSINKKNANFQRSADVSTGSKRSISYLTDYLRRKDYDVAAMWKNIADVLVKTIIVAEPHVLHAYRNCRPGVNAGHDSVCFEVLGFDVLLDRKLKPWVLEINRAPSFGTDEKIDLDIKGGLLNDSFRLVNMRASDKRRGMAAQKAESQKRLLRPTKRLSTEQSETERRRLDVEQRKIEIRAKLAQVRRENAREDYENRNMGRFRRIYPPQDRFLKEKYDQLIAEAFEVFLSGRAATLQRDACHLMSGQVQEDELLDMLHQCDITDSSPTGSSKGFRGPKPLSSMPTVVSHEQAEDDDDEDDEEDNDEEEEYGEYSPPGTPPSVQNGMETRARDSVSLDGRPPIMPHAPPPGTRPPSARSRPASRTSMTSLSQRPHSAQRPRSARPLSASNSGRNTASSQRSRSLTRPKSSTNRIPSSGLSGSMNMLSAAFQQKQEDHTKKMLLSLTDMRIKFPGKTDEEAAVILGQIHESWKYHKPRIASYWLVKLDSIKRRKVIDIVRSNVKALIQRVWRCADAENVRLYRIVTKVFNRLLWSHGQGLWNCFSTSGSSWETIFSKSTDAVTEMELECCRRVVKLCQDCLLIVYQFAAETKSSQQGGPPSSAAGEGRTPHQRSGSSWGPPTKIGTWNTSSPTAMVPISQRMSRLYPSNSLEKL
ncbi:tubulin polyglutamylase TTLL7-like [Diadema antillarum]|uniref:tubulin polyglutamylase TTLL7-like n=1 Tax=Diadema antillarum TaxID=105358 RepID=UPI003A86F22F